MSFLAELKRRNVIKVGAAYVVSSWLIAQVVDLTEINDLINTRAVTWGDIAFAGLAVGLGLGLAWLLRRAVRKALAQYLADRGVLPEQSPVELSTE